jgi:phosphotransferase system HPr (HPr) family protein
MHSAAEFYKQAKSFTSDVAATSNGNSVNAKKLTNLQTLELLQGNTITISADGEYAEEAVAHLVRVIEEPE